MKHLFATHQSSEAFDARKLTFCIALGDIPEFLLARGNESVDRRSLQYGEMLLQCQTHDSRPGRVIGVGASRWFVDDLVDTAESSYLKGGDTQCFGRLLLVRSVLPHDGSARLRRDDEVECVFQDKHAVAHGKSQRAA